MILTCALVIAAFLHASPVTAKDFDPVLFPQTKNEGVVQSSEAVLVTTHISETTAQQPIFPLDVKGVSTYFSSTHPGIDVRADIGSPVYAPQDGIVVDVSYQPGGYGNYVHIVHEMDSKQSIHSLFAHLQKSEVQVGSRVKRGEQIGTVGLSGRTTGPHLHYETRECALGAEYYLCSPIDPLRFL